MPKVGRHQPVNARTARELSSLLLLLLLRIFAARSEATADLGCEFVLAS